MELIKWFLVGSGLGAWFLVLWLNVQHRKNDY